MGLYRENHHYLMFRNFFGSEHHCKNTTSNTVAVAQQPVASKISKLKVFRQTQAVLILLMMFVNGVICMSFQSFLSPYLRQELDFSILQASEIWMTIAVFGMFGTFLIGWIADKIGTLNALMICFVFLVIALIVLVFIPTWFFISIAAVCFSLAFYSIFALIPSYISQSYTINETNIIFAGGNVALGLGGVVGNTLGGITKEATGTFLYGYGASIFLCFVLMGFCLHLKQQK